MPTKGNQPINLSDIIGFIIAFLAFAYMTIRPLIDKRRSRNVPPEFEEEPEDERSIAEEEFDDDDFEDEPVLAKRAQAPGERSLPPSSKKREKDRFRFQSTIEKRRQVSAVEQRKLQSAVAGRRLKELEASFEEELTEEEIYNAKEVQQPSRAAALIQGSTLRKGVILSEIFGKPKAFGENDGRTY